MKRAMAIAAGVIAFAASASAQSGEYWTDPNTGERIEILESRPIPMIPLRTMFEDRCMLIDLAAPPPAPGTTPAHGPTRLPIPDTDNFVITRCDQMLAVRCDGNV